MSVRKMKLQLANEALIQAQKVRQEAGIAPKQPINIYDCADKLGIEVHFVDVPSMEGIYYKHPQPLILISSLRPPGRQAFSCAHEMGHHFFNHGTRVDELHDETTSAGKFNPEEYLADSFASFLLMPKILVQHAFRSRRWCTETCTPLQIYIIAGWLGVGYTTLINHMVYTLKLTSPRHAQTLSKTSPKDIRAMLLGEYTTENVVVVDPHWVERAIDIQVNDLILAPLHTVCEGNIIRLACHSQEYAIFRGLAPGQVARLFDPTSGWTAYVRISRSDYTGRSIYRHLEDPDYEHPAEPNF